MSDYLGHEDELAAEWLLANCLCPRDADGYFTGETNTRCPLHSESENSQERPDA